MKRMKCIGGGGGGGEGKERASQHSSGCLIKRMNIEAFPIIKTLSSDERKPGYITLPPLPPPRICLFFLLDLDDGISPPFTKTSYYKMSLVHFLTFQNVHTTELLQCSPSPGTEQTTTYKEGENGCSNYNGGL